MPWASRHMRIVTDLNFVDESTSEHLHGLHTYPARMHPSLARYLVKSVSVNKGIIIDPFCGSGTVLLEAQLQGIESIGIDINPLAVLISEVKTNPPSPGELALIGDLLDKILNSSYVGIPSSYEIDSHLQYWFKPNIMSKLQALRQVLEERIFPLCTERMRKFLLVCYSSTVRQSSNLRKGEFKLYRMANDRLLAHSPEVFILFRNVLEKATIEVNEYWCLANSLHHLGQTTVIQGDSTNATLYEEIRGVVTSPPYGDHPTTIAYGQYSRLSLEMLGYDVQLVKNIDHAMDLSLKAKTIKIVRSSSMILDRIIERIMLTDQKRANDVMAYFCMLYASMENIGGKLPPEGKVALVVGERTVRGIRIPTPHILIELFSELGLSIDFKHDRRILSKRLPSRNSEGDTINKETIIIFKKQER